MQVMVLYQGSFSSTLLVEKTCGHFLICFRTESTKLATNHVFKVIVVTHTFQLEADLGAISLHIDRALGHRQ